MENIKNVIKKTLELCQERVTNNVLLIESETILHTTTEYVKSGLPIKKVYDANIMPSWEIQKLPTEPGTYIYENMSSLDTHTANWLYGWALNGKANGVKVAFVSKSFPRTVTYNTQKITL
jgi:hypothetical protein